MLKRTVFMLVAALLILGVVGVGAQAEVLRIGLLTDQSGALAIYGFELEQGFKLGLLYAAGVEP